jgi:hypothetical protein
VRRSLSKRSSKTTTFIVPKCAIVPKGFRVPSRVLVRFWEVIFPGRIY